WVVAVPPGRLYGRAPLLLLLCLLGAGLGVLGVWMLVRTARAWARSAGPWPSKVLSLLQTTAVIAAAIPLLYWTAFAWRGSPGHVRDVARRIKESGIWVQSTLVLYETGMGVREGYRPADFKTHPLFPRLAPEIRDSWSQIPGLLPPVAVTLWGRHPEFVRSLVAALHREGVPLMAGTDAMGAPFIFPGESLHRELTLLQECGLTPREVLWTATVGPARFLGREAEFGTISAGKRADLLLLDGDPTADLSCLRRPVGVMVRGRYLPRADLDAAVDALR
ncbi:MAG: amidohydrolase family protein, partial [Acidobacteriota bacterium]